LTAASEMMAGDPANAVTEQLWRESGWRPDPL